VILPVFNGKRYLAEAIDSALAQVDRLLEIIVVDDGSVDGSADVAQEYAKRESSVCCLRQTHQGSGAARNLGVERACGEYFAFLDADDVWPGNRLALQRTAFDRNPEADLVFGHLVQFLSPELSAEERRGIRCSTDAMPATLATTLLVPQPVFHRVGPFETSLRVGEFLSWYLRAMDLQLKTIMLPDVVLRRRIHSRNQGRHAKDARTDYVRALKTALDRRREQTRGDGT
jgi:glycosyltransferase involved in cell wall biosynthesis